MHHRPWSLAGLAAAATFACTIEPQRDRDDERTTTSGALGATSFELSMPAHVRPPGGTTGAITVEATLTDVPATAQVVLVFAGDTAAWPDADLPQTRRRGNKFSFSRSLRAPALPGLHDMRWRFALTTARAATFGPEVAGRIEVTCSDGDFCNGEERFVRGKCVKGIDPCDDGVACTTDTCDSAKKSCRFTVPEGSTTCLACTAEKCVPHCGRHQECGDDGCGGSCGQCPGNLTCVSGTCADVGGLDGTCANPRKLYGTDGVIPAGGLGLASPYIVTGDTSTGIDAVKVGCGGTGIKEIIYEFTLPTAMGLDIRMTSASGDPNALDTVLAVHAADATCSTSLGFSGFCSDDNSPPGGLSSRVYGPLAAGSYRLIATGYSASQVGPYRLEVKLVPGCVPQCDGKFCGADGCGYSCGGCGAGFECNASGRCAAVGCVPSCKPSNECGDDGCGQPCGTCAAGSSCVIETGRCVADSACNHLVPTCKSCSAKEYCGSDCRCHKADERLIDLVPADATVLLPSVELEWRSFDTTGCGVAEGCVPGPGRWLLMRFTTDIWNQSLAGFKPGDPATQPDLFSYHTCHQHYHFSGFAQYELRTLDGRTAVAGRKLSYCMEDSYRYQASPLVACEPASTCDDQGINGGWADSYPNTLDCQWLALAAGPGTTVPAGFTPVALDTWYTHRTCTNTGRTFPEETFDNNCVDVQVYLPTVPDDGRVYRYADLALPPPP